MIRVLFFASLREALKCDRLELDATGLTNLNDVRSRLREQGAVWEAALADVRLQMALNQELVSADAAVQDGDEVALFPPVTGG